MKKKYVATKEDLQTWLMDAVANNHVDKVKDLIDRGADVNLQCDNTRWDPGVGTYDPESFLHVAVIKKNVKMLKILLSSGADAKSCTGNLLMDGSTDTLELLLQAGANPDSIDETKHSAFDIQAEYYDWLLLRPAKPSSKKDLAECMQNGLLLLKYGAKKYNPNTLLAAKCKRLLSKGLAKNESKEVGIESDVEIV